VAFFIKEILNEVNLMRPGRRDLRQTALVLLGGFGLIGGILWWRGREIGPWLLALGALLGFWGLVWPGGFRIVHRLWMGLAFFLGFFVQRIILTLLFYLTVTPLSLVMRCLGKDFLDLKMNDRNSYWHHREDRPYDPKSTEKMY